MQTHLFLVIIIVVLKCVQGRNDFTIKFIKSFIENENKPTHLMYRLCWDKMILVKMVKELSKSGIRSSSSKYNISKYRDQDILFLTDLGCNIRNAFQFPFRWLVLSTKDINASATVLWQCPIRTDSDLVLAENMGNEQFLMTEIYRPTVKDSMITTMRGYYKLELPAPLKEDRLNLQYDAATKLCWICAKHAFEMLNATPQYIWSYRWGYKVNGQWSGMINDINSNKADLGTNCVLYPDRLDVVTYTDVVAPLHMRFIFRQPSLAYVSNIFSLPFSTNVWVAIIICVVASTVTLYLTSRWETKSETSASQLDGSMGDALLLTLSAVAQQGCFIEPRRAPGRIMEWRRPTPSARWRTSPPPRSRLPQMTLTTAVLFSRTSRIPFMCKYLRESYQYGGSPEFYDIYNGVEKIRQGLFAFHSIVEPVYRRIEETFLETEKCDLTEIDYVNRFDAFTPVKKDSPFLELIRVVYKQIRESGIQSAQIKRLQVPKPKCTSSAASFSSVGILGHAPRASLHAVRRRAISVHITSRNLVPWAVLQTVIVTFDSGNFG
ncbi:hypothetical protein ACJJTC_002016 [Scirpophaga incertulas]